MTPYSLRTLLRVRLYTAICLENDLLDTSVSSQFRRGLFGEFDDLSPLERIALKRIFVDQTMVYRSTIVLQQATVHPSDRVQVAKQWVQAVQAVACPPEAPRFLQVLWPTMQIWADPQGGILMRLTIQGWHHWLQALIQRGEQAGEPFHDRASVQPVFDPPGRLWSIQLAYARCCGLLRSAMRERYLRLTLATADREDWQISLEIPWSTSSLMEPTSALYAWLGTIVDYLDADVAGEIRALGRLVESLVQAFQVCDRAYPIGNPTLQQVDRQVYLGLVWLTQQCLKRYAGAHLLESL